MKACIHRGATQIGGSCVELEHEGQHLLIDFGLPLDAENASATYLPQEAIRQAKEANTLCAVIISHPHIDHYGLLHHLPEGTTVVTGEAARTLIRAAAPFTGQPLPHISGPVLKDREPLQIGPFCVTPFLVDHSAYDAYSLLVEAGDRTIFYSGDFRGHGRKAALFEIMVGMPPAPIHALLMEGTSMGRPKAEEIRYPTEAKLEAEMAAVFRDTAGLAMVYSSAQNIDRVVTLYRAAKKAGRELVIDLYAAAILEATGNTNLPQSDWDGVKLYVPHRQRIQIKKLEKFALLERHKKNRIYVEDISKNPERYALLFRPLHMQDLEKAGCLSGASYIYSQWQGYWDSGSYDAVKRWLERNEITFHNIHTSGHADPHTLKRFVKALAPQRLVPIHSFHPEEFTTLYDPVEYHSDGEWWEV